MIKNTLTLLCLTISFTIVVDSQRISKILYPCRYASNIITCGGSEEYDLKRIFQTLAKNLTRDRRYFDKLIIYNTGITEINDNEFDDNRFKSLVIRDATSLSKIDRLAFNGTAVATKRFVMRNVQNLSADYDDVYDFFEALNSLENLTELEIENTNLRVISAFGFTKLTKLESIRFTNAIESNKIRSVDDFAFNSVSNLKHLDLSNNSIEHLSEHVFDFMTPSNETLSINLEHNKLRSDSFAENIFAGSKRPIILDLSHNNLSYLNESIFERFFGCDRENIIKLYANNFDCTDCRMLWLYDSKDRYKDRVFGLECNNDSHISNNVLFWDIEPKLFDKCRVSVHIENTTPGLTSSTGLIESSTVENTESVSVLHQNQTSNLLISIPNENLTINPNISTPTEIGIENEYETNANSNISSLVCPYIGALPCAIVQIIINPIFYVSNYNGDKNYEPVLKRSNNTQNDTIHEIFKTAT